MALRFPWATLTLAIAVLGVYGYSSGGLAYPDSALLAHYAYGQANPLALLFSLFFHIGLHHLVGNWIPLVAFALLLEWALSGFDVGVVFLTAGTVSALVFSFLNPSSYLIGASAGISGLVTAAALIRPKLGVALLLTMPLVLSFVAFPLVDWVASASFSNLGQTVNTLNTRADQLQQRGQTQQATSVRIQANLVNQTLSQQKLEQVQEAQSQPDTLVHVVGALVGVLYVLLFFRWKLYEGFADLFDSVNLRLQKQSV